MFTAYLWTILETLIRHSHTELRASDQFRTILKIEVPRVIGKSFHLFHLVSALRILQYFTTCIEKALKRI